MQIGGIQSLKSTEHGVQSVLCASKTEFTDLIYKILAAC